MNRIEEKHFSGYKKASQIHVKDAEGGLYGSAMRFELVNRMSHIGTELV